MVRKILIEGGFAEQSLGEVTIVRQDARYKKRGPIWVYRDQKIAVPPVKSEPSVEVVILPRRPEPGPHPMIEKIEGRRPENVEYQSLQVTVRNFPVRNLQAKVSFDDEGIRFKPEFAFYLDWGNARISDFLANQTDQIRVWLAYKIGDIERILLNVWNIPILLPLNEIYQRKNPYIDMKLQFVGEGLLDEKRRDYRLNAQSWSSISLTERSP